MKHYIFCVCLPSGAAEFADILAACPADAVRALVARFPGCRANVINVTAA